MSFSSLRNFRKPDFIGIGAAKAGTSWLWKQLQRSPELSLPPQKELHYFDRSRKYPSSNWFADANPLYRLFGNKKHHARFRHLAWQRISSAASRRDGAVFRWYFKYYFGYCNDKWYLSLFDTPEVDSKLTGEITPGYALLEKEDIQRVHRLVPNAKILFLLRNPVERAWSHARYSHMRNRFDQIDNIEAVRTFIDSPAQERHSDYLTTLNRWRAVYNSGQIHISFFDDLRDNPEELLRGIANFLEIEPIPHSNNKKINKSIKKDMPKEIRNYLNTKYRQEIWKMKESFGSHAITWYNKL